jgi:CRISPR-associated protein (TIGR02584 family)
MGEQSPYRNIFLFVSGRTPQIITETLFFFLTRQRPAVHPDEIHVLTTSEGKTAIVNQLLKPTTGHFFRFCQDYRLNPRKIRFSEDTIEVVRNAHGAQLTDIRSDAENLAAADHIVAKVRTLTSDPRTRLLASMAGGRKTMGLYLGFALQFYGRVQDRLTHVLVSPPELESNPGFFYPSPRTSVRCTSKKTAGGQAIGEVTVAEVPLVFLGHKLPVLRERADLRYAELVAHSQREVDRLTAQEPLVVDRMSKQLHVGASHIRLSGLEFSLYYFIARKRQRASCNPDCPGCRLCTVGADDFLDPASIAALESIVTEIGVRDPRLRELRWWTEGEGGKQRFLQVSARIKKKAREVLGESVGPYIITPLQTRHERKARYTVSLPKELIRLV